LNSNVGKSSDFLPSLTVELANECEQKNLEYSRGLSKETLTNRYFRRKSASEVNVTSRYSLGPLFFKALEKVQTT